MVAVVFRIRLTSRPGRQTRHRRGALRRRRQERWLLGDERVEVGRCIRTGRNRRTHEHGRRHTGSGDGRRVRRPDGAETADRRAASGERGDGGGDCGFKSRRPAPRPVRADEPGEDAGRGTDQGRVRPRGIIRRQEQGSPTKRHHPPNLNFLLNKNNHPQDAVAAGTPAQLADLGLGGRARPAQANLHAGHGRVLLRPVF